MGNFDTDKVYRFLARLKFLFSATNQHGVHSPFIYSFVTKGLYKKGSKKLSVTENVLVKSIAYFDVKKVGLVNHSEELKIKLDSIFQDLNYRESPFDIIYADALSKPFKTVSQKHIHNDSLLLLEGIYKNKARTQRWKAIKNLDQVTVTIDLYYCGIVFFRREQAKEHFKIRI
ncbi:hypothetical protein [Maribacter sp. 2304DJ31-5]|uniref:hypothetical protein n=1 Tax=Maribacter sp. 2304DJ31-5 TaxID=3386273 RepID=UPI0039BD2801